EVGQANNVYVFPGVGLGVLIAEAPVVTDRMFLAAARELANAVTDDRLASGALYPPVAHLRTVSRRIAIAVVQEAGRPTDAEGGIEAIVDAAMWWPSYVPYLPAHPTERRRVSET
ncbi:MAG: malic enzyme-like NAD(P)-binding protein, partial [Chloroflexota bacterium]